MTDEDAKTLKLLEDLIRRVVREELDKDRVYRPFTRPLPPSETSKPPVYPWDGPTWVLDAPTYPPVGGSGV